MNTSGWILLADPNYGVLNQLLTKLPFVEKGPFNIYSFWGIVFIHLTGIGFAAKVMLLVPSFRNMDATLEEASRMAGQGPLGTLVRIVIPAVAPADSDRLPRVADSVVRGVRGRAGPGHADPVLGVQHEDLRADQPVAGQLRCGDRAQHDHRSSPRCRWCSCNCG